MARLISWKLVVAMVAMAMVGSAVADDILKTTGFTDCGANSTVKVDKVDINYNNANKTVIFDVAGSSNKEQNVTATLNVTAYGESIYSNSFNPCDPDTFVEQLCPVPEGSFSARGTQAIPAEFADQVPSIAFQIPDIAAEATLQLKSLDTGADVACIQSQVSNGKTASIPAVSYVAAGIAAAALVVSGISAVGAVMAGSGAGASGGAGTVSPSFTEVFGWFQGMALNGMLSVKYPPVYRSFAKNFAFSTGLIPWTAMQSSIDSFRSKTGGNLTDDSVDFLQNATLIFPDGSTATPEEGFFKIKRAFESFVALAAREIQTSVNGTGADDGSGSGSSQNFQQTVSGIQAYAEELAVPKSNTFMTVLLIVAIAIAATALSILLLKLILEFWALFGTFPKSLTGFRKHYWGSMARAITTLILLFYGIWVLYCIFQFTQGDSWAAKALAGVTLGVFTAILAFFSFKIWITAQRLKDNEGDINGLYDEKDIWVKYSLFYESYRKDYWWVFVPTILYMFARGCVLAAADGDGRTQTIAQLVIEGVMLIMLLWTRPYERRSGNIINIVMQVVRFLSVACILIFVEQFGIEQTTQTIAGVALIAVQSVLTVVLVVLIAWNAINACCKANPHRQRRKEMEKLKRDMDALTPLDARNSLLLDRPSTSSKMSMFSFSGNMKEKAARRSISPDRLITVEEGLKPAMMASSHVAPAVPGNPTRGYMRDETPPGPPGRQPTLPDLSGGFTRVNGVTYKYGGRGYRGF